MTPRRIPARERALRQTRQAGDLAAVERERPYSYQCLIRQSCGVRDLGQRHVRDPRGRGQSKHDLILWTPCSGDSRAGAVELQLLQLGGHEDLVWTAASGGPAGRGLGVESVEALVVVERVVVEEQ
jgi:hypothetical protein